MKGQAVRSTLFLHGQARSLLRRKRQALIERERERERERQKLMIQKDKQRRCLPRPSQRTV